MRDVGRQRERRARQERERRELGRERERKRQERVCKIKREGELTEVGQGWRDEGIQNKG